eukprot:Lithocolla_globosa_v1_NODE_8023_length_871_cov_9.549020.p1 type:complete len:167 gc:universal NODE_8023_length_871_cov_9.549020:591-91(-)
MRGGGFEPGTYRFWLYQLGHPLTTSPPYYKCFPVLMGIRWQYSMSIGTNWCQLVPIGVNWYQLVPIGTSWCRLVSIGVNWCQLVSIGVNWCQLVPIGASFQLPPIWHQFGTNLAVTATNWLQLIPIGLPIGVSCHQLTHTLIVVNCCQLVAIGIIWCQLVSFGVIW